jgi:small subunit ribosomal protein S1
VRDFGAFVDIGGMQALLPVSEMTWGRVEDTKALYSPGDIIEAIIINLDWENDRVTLSFKDTLPDPWNDVVSKYREGSVHKGRVSRLTDFGAFITLEAGVDGLLHISKLSKGKKIKHARDVLTTGTDVEVRIEKIDRENKRISLDLAANDKGSETSDSADDFSGYMAQAPKTMGTFGDLLQKSGKKR